MAKDLKKEVDALLKKKEISDKDIKALKEYISELEKAKAASEEEVKHQVAENRNMLRRRDEVESDLKKYSAARLGEAIVPDIDLLKTVVSGAENIDNPEVQNYLAGFKMVLTKMETTLNDVGIKQIDVKPGSEYDSSCEQSIEQVESDKYKSGQVAQVVSNGYKIHDRVLIHAKVKVAK